MGFSCLKEIVPEGSDVTLVERLCRTVSSAAIRLHTLDANLLTFLAHTRRSFYVFHMVPTVHEDSLDMSIFWMVI